MTGIVGPEYAGPAMIAVTSALSAYTTFLPPLTEVRRAQPNSDFAGDVRTGEVVATVITVGIGAVASSIVGNAVPLAISVLAAAVLVTAYEWTLQGKPFAVPHRVTHTAFDLVSPTTDQERSTT